MQTTEVLELILAARYIGGSAFSSMARDVDTLISSSSGLAKVGASMDLIGKSLTVAGLAAADFAFQSIKQFEAYNQAVQHLVEVHAVAGNQVGTLTNVLDQTAVQWGESTTEMATGLYKILSSATSLGVSFPQIINDQIIPALAAFSKASGNGLPGSIDFKQSADDLQALAAAFNIPVGQWPQVLAELTKVEAQSGTVQGNLLAGVLRGAPTYNELGGSLQSLIAMTATLNELGINGTRPGVEVAAGLRHMIGSKAGLGLLSELGIDPNKLFDASGKMEDPGQALGLIYEKILKLPPGLQRYQAEQTLFGAVGNRALGQFLATGLDKYQLFMQQEKNIGNPLAYLNQMALAGQDPLKFAMQRAAAAIQILEQTVGKQLEPVVVRVVNAFTAIVMKLNDFLQSPAGASLIAHAPQILGGIAAVGLGGGPLLQAGGGKLMDWASKQDEAHTKSLQARGAYSEVQKLERTHLEERHALAKKNLERDFQKQLKHTDNVGALRAVQAGKMARFEEKHALTMKRFDALSQVGMPGLEPSAFGVVGGHIKGFGKGMMAFGEKFSPLTHLKRLHAGLQSGNWIDAIGAGADKLNAPFRAVGKVGKHIGGAGKVFQDTWAMAGNEGGLFNAVKAGGGKLFEPLTLGIKGLAQAAMGVIPAMAGMGSALLPIIAIVLLVVGAIVIGILIFTRYRKQAEALGQAILNALLPVFNWLKSVVLAVLKSIQDAWHAHAKEVDAAMKKLFPAIKGIIPVIQAVGAVIAFIFGAIIVVIGALVNAFIAALPFIINVFTGIFDAIGALWRFFDDIVHGRFTKAMHDLMDLFHALWDVVVNLFGMLGTFIYNAVAGALSGLGDLVISAVNNIPGGTKLLDFLGIHLGGAKVTTNNNGGGAGKATLRAEGGVVRPGELTAVGEKGWEFAHFPAGTRIYSHQQSMAMLHALTRGGGPSRVQVDVSHGGEGHGRSGVDERQPGRLGTRSPAEEYFFARRIQEQRESLWERYPNRSRQFDNDYHRAYQYYG